MDTGYRKSTEYRDRLRWGCRHFMTPDHAALLQGVPISNLHLDDLEALYELILGTKPRRDVTDWRHA